MRIEELVIDILSLIKRACNEEEPGEALKLAQAAQHLSDTLSRLDGCGWTFIPEKDERI